MKLHIAVGLDLPVDVVTQVLLIAGKRGSGKTNTAKRVVEQVHKAKVPFGVLDPVDVWWGLKAGRGGTREGGLENVYIFGGQHADYPLAPTGGRLMADLFVEYRISAVMAVREWSGADRARFVTDFATELLARNKDPFHLVVEEAHDLIPLNAFAEEKRSKGAMLRLEKLGRSSGIGETLLTQRLAALDNTARSQADVLVMHRTTGPHDRKALNGWIEEHHATDEERQAFLGSLPTLKTGEAFVWAPDFPEERPIGLRRTTILECETFNSHATPKVGEKRVEPKELTKVDLDRLSKAMAATVEKAKADDPAELRKVIATLRKELTATHKPIPPAPAQPKIVERPVLKDAQIKRLEVAVERSHNLIDKLRGELTGSLAEAIKPVTLALQSARSAGPSRVPTTGNPVGARVLDGPAARAAAGRRTGAVAAPERDQAEVRSAQRAARTTTDLGKGEDVVLRAIAQHDEGVGPEQLSILTGYKRSTRNTYLQRLATAGLIERNGGGLIRATGAGRDALGSDFEPLPTGDALRAYWLDRLTGGEREILALLVAAYPQPVERESIEGYARSSRNTYLQRLSSRKLVVADSPGRVRAADGLFG